MAKPHILPLAVVLVEKESMRKKMSVVGRRWLLGAFTLLIGGSAQASMLNLLVDGSFQSATLGKVVANGSLAGSPSWQVTGFVADGMKILGVTGTGIDTLTTGSPDAGSTQVLGLTANTGNETLTQSGLNLVAGVTYQVGYDAMLVGTTGTVPLLSLVITDGITASVNQTLTSTQLNGFTRWTTVAYTFTAPVSTVYNFAIGFTNGTKDVYLDRAFVTAVPEPSFFAVFSLLAGTALFFSFRKRTSQNAEPSLLVATGRRSGS